MNQKRNPLSAGSARRDYEPPTIRSFTNEEILATLGPAQGYTGQVPGGGGTL